MSAASDRMKTDPRYHYNEVVRLVPQPVMSVYGQHPLEISISTGEHT